MRRNFYNSFSRDSSDQISPMGFKPYPATSSLSMRLMSIKYPNNYRMKPSEHIEQELIIQNDGLQAWPNDTYLVFSGVQNQLGVVESLFLGAIGPQQCSEIRISIRMPALFPSSQDRYFLEYEMRYNYKSMSIGVPIKLTILMDSRFRRDSSSSVRLALSEQNSNASNPSNSERKQQHSDRSTPNQNRNVVDDRRDE